MLNKLLDTILGDGDGGEGDEVGGGDGGGKGGGGGRGGDGGGGCGGGDGGGDFTHLLIGGDDG